MSQLERSTIAGSGRVIIIAGIAVLGVESKMWVSGFQRGGGLGGVVKRRVRYCVIGKIEVNQ